MPRLPLAAMMVLLAGAAQAETGGYSAPTNYVLRCSGCHGIEGMGTVFGGVPPFPDSVGHLAGIDIGRTYMLHVPGVISSSLTDTEIAEVMNYIIARWDAEIPFEPFTTEEVSLRRSYLVEDVVAYRREVVAALAGQGITVADYPWP